MFDYPVKPIDQDELRPILKWLAERRATIMTTDSGIAFATKMASPGENDSRVRSGVDRKILLVAPDDIIYCNGNCCRVLLEEEKNILLTRHLKAVGKLLPERFSYAHSKSYIVNLNKIRQCHRIKHYLLFSNSKRIPVSRPIQEFL